MSGASAPFACTYPSIARMARRLSEPMSPLNILIVDDHAFQREYMAHLARDMQGDFVDTAANGWDALRKLRLRRFDLVITDLMMDGVDGVQLIQSLAEFRHPPAVALVSASPKRLLASACLVAKLLGLRVIAHACKPLAPGDIEHMLRQFQYPHDSRPQTHAVSRFNKYTLLHALESGQIQAWFQPKLALIDNSICGVEALARWVQNDGSVLLPRDFLPWLSLHGLDENLLERIIKVVVEAQNGWLKLGCMVPVSINLPTHLLDDRSLPDRLLNMVTLAGGSPHRICFELTEGTTASHLSDFHASACRLRMMGFKLAQDDFGQGYSSIYNLLSVPFTELKIDRSLIQDCTSDDKACAILESAIALGRRLGVIVVAEGVENADQLALLRRLDCTAVQGTYVAEAMDYELMCRSLLGSFQTGQQRSTVAHKRLPTSPMSGQVALRQNR